MYGTINYEGELIIRDRREFVNLYEKLIYTIPNKKTGEEEEISFIK